MKKVITFTKSIDFKTRIAEITNIEVNHDLELKENNELKGNLIVSGKYKMTEASVIEEDFNFNLPSVIAIDSKYDISNMDISISDFNYEIINEESLNITVDIELTGLEEVRSDIKIPIEVDEIKEKIEYEDPIENLEEELNDLKEESNQQQAVENKNISTILSDLTDTTETFSTYHVHIVREGDTIDQILDKYNINKEELSNYNNLDNINIGTKLIIPCSND